MHASILATSNSLKWSTFIAFTFLFQFIIRERERVFAQPEMDTKNSAKVCICAWVRIYVRIFHNVVCICDCMTFLPSLLLLLLLLRCVDLLSRLITHSHTCKNLLNLKRKFMSHIHFHSIPFRFSVFVFNLFPFALIHFIYYLSVWFVFLSPVSFHHNRHEMVWHSCVHTIQISSMLCDSLKIFSCRNSFLDH